MLKVRLTYETSKHLNRTFIYCLVLVQVYVYNKTHIWSHESVLATDCEARHTLKWYSQQWWTYNPGAVKRGYPTCWIFSLPSHVFQWWYQDICYHCFIAHHPSVTHHHLPDHLKGWAHLEVVYKYYVWCDIINILTIKAQ